MIMYEIEELLIELERTKEQLTKEKRCLQVSKYQKTKKKIEALSNQLEQLRLKALEDKISSCRHYFISKKENGTNTITCLCCGLTNERQSDQKIAAIMNKQLQLLIPSIKIRKECTSEKQVEQFITTYQEVSEQYPNVPIDLLDEEIKVRLKSKK